MRTVVAAMWVTVGGCGPVRFGFEETRQLELAGPAELVAGDCGQLLLTLRDPRGEATESTERTSLVLGGAGAGDFFADTTCTTPLTEASLGKDESELSLSFRDDLPESLELFIEGPDEWGRAALLLEVVPPSPVGLILEGPSEVVVSACSSVFSVTTVDTAGLPLPVLDDTSLSLSGGELFADASCATPITAITLVAQSSSAGFHARGSATPGTLDISVSGGGLGTASRPLLVTPPALCDTAAALFVPFAAGSGTTGDPYLVCTGEQLDRLRQELDAAFRLEDEIDLSTWAGNSFLPIGTDATPFTGRLDGAGHTIHGFHHDDAAARDVGLFGVLENAHIEDLVLSGVAITADGDSGGLAGRARDGTVVSGVSVSGEVHDVGTTFTNLGLVVGTLYDATLLDCHSDGAVTGPWAGGIVGRAYGFVTLSNVSSTASMNNDAFRIDIGGIVGVASGAVVIDGATYDGTVEGLRNLGGIVGHTDGGELFVRGATVSGTVLGHGDSVGGIVGLGDGLVYLDEVQVGASVSGSNDVGGLVGHLSHHGVLLRSSFAGSVDGDDTVGGAVGRLFGRMQLVEADAQLTVALDGGGLAGALLGSGVIEDSFATGTLEVTGGYAGGLVGRADAGAITRAYSTVAVSGALSTQGGLVGSGGAVVTSAVWDTELSGQDTSPSGTGLSTAAMAQASSFADWDLDAVWIMPAGDTGPPRLRWAEGAPGCDFGVLTTPSPEAFAGNFEHDGVGWVWDQLGDEDGRLWAGHLLGQPSYAYVTWELPVAIPSGALLEQASALLRPNPSGDSDNWDASDALVVAFDTSDVPPSGALDHPGAGGNRALTTTARWPETNGLTWGENTPRAEGLEAPLQELLDASAGFTAGQSVVAWIYADPSTTESRAAMFPYNHLLFIRWRHCP